VSFTALPHTAAWRHVDARDGFESVVFREAASGYVIDGHTAAVEDGEPWAVHYTLDVDDEWCTQQCFVRSWSALGALETLVTRDPAGHWRVDGVLVPELEGCLDVDLEASACTNLLPVRRARAAVGKPTDAPAAYVHAPGLEIERLEQTYVRLARNDDDDVVRFEYRAPRFGYDDELEFGADGLVVEYPGIATRLV
jgi:hypothetical protein